MRGDRILVEPHHRRAAAAVLERLRPRLLGRGRPLVVAIAGESGSGKSELAEALATALREAGIPSVVVQQDDYFVLPPRRNDRRRRTDPSWIGPGEVRLDALDASLREIRSGARVIEKPLVDYAEDRIETERVFLDDPKVAIVEGTYTSMLSEVDLRIFIDRTYHQTAEARRRRAREPQDDFLERVLEIEHRIISPQRADADLLVTEAYEVRDVNRRTTATTGTGPPDGAPASDRARR